MTFILFVLTGYQIVIILKIDCNSNIKKVVKLNFLNSKEYNQ